MALHGATLALCLLLGGIGSGCGADASDERSAPGRPSPEQSTPALRAGAGAASSAAGEGAQAASEAGERELDAPSLPASLPVTATPPEPAPLPSAELETPIPVDARLPADVVVPPGDCRFEFLGEWVRCEDAGWPHAVASAAPDLLSCMQQCLDSEDCRAVTDYFWLGIPGLGCYLHMSSCDAPAFAADWGEEDGGRDFRRSCAAPD